MADSKITALTALTAADPVNDMFPVVDVSDTTMAASGTTKKISVNNILGASGIATLASATITGDLTVRTNKLVVTSTGVGMGTATPSSSYVLDLTTANDARARQWIADSSFIGSGNLANGFVIRTLSNSTDGIKFTNYAQTTEFMRIDSTGLAVANGNVILSTPGKGIDFSATASGSGTMTSELLNDYEEGTFTPNIGGTATYTTQTGRYTKIGNRVFATIRLTVLLVGTGSSNTISGLPFVAGTALGNISVGYFANLALSPVYISGYVNDAASTVTMTGLTAASASITNAFAVIGNTADLSISLSYEV